MIVPMRKFPKGNQVSSKQAADFLYRIYDLISPRDFSFFFLENKSVM